MGPCCALPSSLVCIPVGTISFCGSRWARPLLSGDANQRGWPGAPPTAAAARRAAGSHCLLRYSLHGGAVCLLRVSKGCCLPGESEGFESSAEPHSQLMLLGRGCLAVMPGPLRALQGARLQPARCSSLLGVALGQAPAISCKGRPGRAQALVPAPPHKRPPPACVAGAALSCLTAACLHLPAPVPAAASRRRPPAVVAHAPAGAAPPASAVALLLVFGPLPAHLLRLSCPAMQGLPGTGARLPPAELELQIHWSQRADV